MQPVIKCRIGVLFLISVKKFT
jgi:hypothetical protein